MENYSVVLNKQACQQACFSFDATIVENFPKFYKETFINWQNYLTSTSDIASFSNKFSDYVSQLFDIFRKMRLWNNLKNEFHLCENSYFTFMQLIDSLPRACKKVIETNGSVTNNLLLNHHVIRKNNLHGKN